MSVFGDFINVWAQRFPGSSLPAAWEEDTRANLTKHKQKVAVLREELEKEEFYVEYLERLLLDVEKHKSNPEDDEENNSAQTVGQKHEDEISEEVCPPGKIKSSNSSSEETQKPVNSAKSSQQQSENELPIALPDTRVARSHSEVTDRSGIIKGLDNRRYRCNTHPNISNYITVIEVNGLNAKRDGMKENTEKEGGAPKKIPPRPPPKRFGKSNIPHVLNATELGKDSSLEKNISGEKSDINGSSNTLDSIDTDERHNIAESISANSSLERNVAFKHEIKQESDENSSIPRDDSVIGDSAESLDSIGPGDEEPYYDLVAQDGEYVYLYPGM